MRNFIFKTIVDTCKSVGIDTVVIKSEEPSTAVSYPCVEVEILQDDFTHSGRKLSKHTMSDRQVIVYERYIVNTAVTLHLMDNDNKRIQQLSNQLLLAFPNGVSDDINNWVQIRVNQAEWSNLNNISMIENGEEGGDKPTLEKLRTIRMGFEWRLTQEQVVPYLKKFKVNIKTGE